MIKRLEKRPASRRTIQIGGRRSSISIEDAFWYAFKEIASARRTPLGELLQAIDRKRTAENLSSAIRVFVLTNIREQIRGLQAAKDQANAASEQAPREQQIGA
jgi:predicted DNA-binding ribbon-helix-helix protein